MFNKERAIRQIEQPVSDRRHRRAEQGDLSVPLPDCPRDPRAHNYLGALVGAGFGNVADGTFVIFSSVFVWRTALVSCAMLVGRTKFVSMVGEGVKGGGLDGASAGCFA